MCATSLVNRGTPSVQPSTWDPPASLSPMAGHTACTASDRSITTWAHYPVVSTVCLFSSTFGDGKQQRRTGLQEKQGANKQEGVVKGLHKEKKKKRKKKTMLNNVPSTLKHAPAALFFCLA